MISNIKSQLELDPRGKKILMRVDLNVPTGDGLVTDNTRLTHVIPSINDILKRGGAVILLSHFDRPKGQFVPSMSLRPVADALSALLERRVTFVDDCLAADDAAHDLQAGQVLLLENLRFHPGEENNDPLFAAKLARLGDAYINDAFAVSHRAHASIVALPLLLPAYAGLGTIAEVKALAAVMHHPQRPVCAIVGGAKISSKLALINNLLEKVDVLMIGGAMANTFAAAQGMTIGRSLYEKGMLDIAKTIIDNANRRGVKLLLPTDATVSKKLEKGVPVMHKSMREIADDDIIADVGPETVADWSEELKNVRTVLWNGPLGAFEITPFDEGTVALARAVEKFTQNGGLSIAGGGDTAAALNHANVALSYVSTAGGAFLEYIEGCILPGIAALNNANNAHSFTLEKELYA